MSPIPMQGLSIFRISSEVWLNLHQEELVHQQHIMEFLITAHWKYGDLKHLYKWVINLQDSLLKCIILEVILVTLDLRVIFVLWWNWNWKLKSYFYIVIKLKTQHIPTTFPASLIFLPARDEKTLGMRLNIYTLQNFTHTGIYKVAPYKY